MDWFVLTGNAITWLLVAVAIPFINRRWHTHIDDGPQTERVLNDLEKLIMKTWTPVIMEHLKRHHPAQPVAVPVVVPPTSPAPPTPLWSPTVTYSTNTAQQAANTISDTGVENA